MVLATPYYIYVSLRLTGCDSGLTKSNGVCQWFSTIGGLGRPRLRLFEPRPVGWGGGTPGFWQYDRKREAAAGAAALGSRQWSPPPTSQRIIIT